MVRPWPDAGAGERDALRADEAEKDLLRFIACGRVDDGKSTLIGRLLHDAGLVPEDQLAAAAADSRKFGTRGRELDLALLLDGLQLIAETGLSPADRLLQQYHGVWQGSVDPVFVEHAY